MFLYRPQKEILIQVVEEGSDVQVQNPVTSTITTISASPTTADEGANFTLTAEVTAEGTSVSTGTVTFYDGTIAIGTANVNSSGGATLSIATLPVGTNTITASYAADSQYAASTSSSTTITILAPDFMISVANPNLMVKRGQTVSTTLTITPENGFSQSLSLSCSGLPAGTTCSFAAPGQVCPTLPAQGTVGYHPGIRHGWDGSGNALAAACAAHGEVAKPRFGTFHTRTV